MFDHAMRFSKVLRYRFYSEFSYSTRISCFYDIYVKINLIKPCTSFEGGPNRTSIIWICKIQAISGKQIGSCVSTPV